MNHADAVQSKKDAHIVPHHSFVHKDAAGHEIKQHHLGAFAKHSRGRRRTQEMTGCILGWDSDYDDETGAYRA